MSKYKIECTCTIGGAVCLAFFEVIETQKSWLTNFIIGTMNPAHYWVRHPLIGQPGSLSVDEVQRLTYKLCYMYYNWAGKI